MVQRRGARRLKRVILKRFKSLIMANADVNADRDNHGRTMLQAATEDDHMDVKISSEKRK